MLSATDRLALAYKVPGYIAGTMTLAQALAQVDADWATANPPPPAPTQAEMAQTVVVDIRNVKPDGSLLSHTRTYGDGRQMSVDAAGDETPMPATPAS
jgi:hypothetical protein